MKRKLLWVGDAACPSGFARATHETLDVLRREFDVTVLGINYRGDPHSYPYPIYTAYAEGDLMGINRLIWMCDTVKPDVIVIQQDPWNIPPYMRQLKLFPEYANVPVVGAIAVDGKNCAGASLNTLRHAIFWTQFGLDEARTGGYTGSASVVPLGVNTDVYRPMDRVEARNRRGLPEALDDAFIVGNVNRNQPRKRWDLTIKYFAEWMTSRKIEDAWLYLHVAPTGDLGVNVKQLAVYYGIAQKLILMEPAVFYGVSEDDMADTYNCMDVNISTTQGEGFGLTTLEAMACGVPVIAPDWAALGDWAKGAAWLIPCTSTAIGPPYVNVLGGIPDQRQFVMALDRLYRDKQARQTNGAAALERAREPRFRWKHIGEAFLAAVEVALMPDNPAEQAVAALEEVTV